MSKQKGREKLPSQGPYVKLHKGTIESLAWRELSHGAKCLFVELWSKTDNADHRSYLSYREASRKLKASRHKVREWFAELEHYGFIVMLQEHSLGVDGKGRASLWRLTDKGTVRGGYEPPTNDFLKWVGELFDPKPYRVRHGALGWGTKTETRFPRGSQGGSHVGTRGGVHTDPPILESGSHGVAIEELGGGSHRVAITSLTTGGASAMPLKTGSQTSVAQNEVRVAELDAALGRLKARRIHHEKLG